MRNILNMKNALLLTLLVMCSTAFSQATTRVQCCPNFIEIVITGSALDSLHLDSVLAITPTVNGQSIRLTNPPVIRCYHDGSPLIFASGEYVKIVNEFGDISGYGNGEMSSFADNLITPFEGTGTGSFWQSYYSLYKGQNTPSLPTTCSGKVYIWSTYPITGGGANAKIVISIWYESIYY